MIVPLSSGPLVMVDDDELDIELQARCIARSRLKNEFKAFTTGREFLSYMRQVKINVESMPAIVFLDINMPGMNGFTVLEELRNERVFVELPVVVFLSSSDSPTDKERCSDLNAGFQEKFHRVADNVNFLNSLLPE